MRKLPAGLTGFLPAPKVDLKALRTACHEAARIAGGQVAEIVETPIATSYHTVLFTFRDEKLAVLANISHPLLAIAEPPRPNEFRPPFREAPELAAALARFAPFTVLSLQRISTARCPKWTSPNSPRPSTAS